MHKLSVLVASSLLTTCSTKVAAEPDYATFRDGIATRRRALAEEWKTTPPDERKARAAAIATEITGAVNDLARYWIGTRWAMGAPQTSTPGVGKINCGTFVGTVLRDVGFQVDVRKLQRQPSLWIIRTFTEEKAIQRWSDAPMERFLEDVAALGPGLFIIGLDFHVGFLLQTEDDLRFIHASYETGAVIDEPARSATPITSSRYRVVGKILHRGTVENWLEGRRIPVKGRW